MTADDMTDLAAYAAAVAQRAARASRLLAQVRPDLPLEQAEAVARVAMDYDLLAVPVKPARA